MINTSTQVMVGSKLFTRGYAAFTVAVMLFVAIFFVALPTPAHAQGSQLFPNGVFSPVFGDDFPFGYGGGPRAPRVPDTAAILERVFSRINSLFDRLFNR